MVKIRSSEITPEHVYLSRRQFMAGIGAVAGSLLVTACAAPAAQPVQTGQATTPAAPGAPAPLAAPGDGEPSASKDTDELGDKLTPFQSVTTYNNFYEFSTDKQAVAGLAKNFRTTPWTVTVGGLVNKPKTFDVEDLLKRYVQQERIYRLRCVEAWSMVIPWLGFPLAALLQEVEPTSQAKYVRFETLLDHKQMPGQQAGWYQWPYAEGLRLDEAMHDLAILSAGLYGKLLLPQNGAPLRLVVPWKYGFKSIKSIVKIELVAEQPTSLWMAAAPDEYGFYANVNPDVSHPRWSQASERRIGELNRRKTLPFNGYADEVAGLYTGMDLRKYY
ncbi:MAG: protein-methionine-sulfoxide reductase catalytic subunit MsrP [Chloroflexi bacterium]|nr:protein-methionine-sulfoxide reductase catalytic subunit MsrP [Chloroflexota bacterium]